MDAPRGNPAAGHLAEIIEIMKHITFDVMLNERFVCTMRMPITLDVVVDYVGDQPVISGGQFLSLWKGNARR